jgi:ribosomal protein S18 acetylase RimI-like enzyme
MFALACLLSGSEAALVRRSLPSDAPALHQLLSTELAAAVAESFRNHEFFVIEDDACDGDALVGCAALRPQDALPALPGLPIRRAHLTMLLVRQESRRRGHGNRLLHKVLDSVEAEAECTTLYVRPTNAPALALYEQAGFTEYCFDERYYSDNAADGGPPGAGLLLVRWRDAAAGGTHHPLFQATDTVRREPPSVGEDARAKTGHARRRDTALPRGQSTRRARIEGSRI